MKNRKQLLFNIFAMAMLGTLSRADEVNLKNSNDDFISKSFNQNEDKHFIAKNRNFGGLFASILLDYKQSSDTVKETFIGTGGPFDNATGQKTNGRLSAKTISGGINLGYGYQWFCSYFGIDLDFSIYNLIDNLKVNKKSNYDFSNHVLKIKRNFSFDTSFRYGLIFGSAMPYLKAGVIVSNWHIRSNYPSLGLLAPLGINKTHHKNKRIAGFLLGAGIDIKYSRHIILGGYAMYTQFNSIQYKHPLIAKSKITPSDLSAGLKMSYLF